MRMCLKSIYTKPPCRVSMPWAGCLTFRALSLFPRIFVEAMKRKRMNNYVFEWMDGGMVSIGERLSWGSVISGKRAVECTLTGWAGLLTIR